MQTYLEWAQIILSIAITAAIMLQVKGGGLGGIFGQADTVYRTRRGVEKTLFRLTIVLVTMLVIVSVIALKLSP